MFGDSGTCGFGAFAEYVAVPESVLAQKPANILFEEAAAAVQAAKVALQALRDTDRIQKGQKVLVYGVSGGIGSFAVQIAKAFEAGVTAVCSTRNVKLARSLGADRVIDYTKGDFTRSGQQYDFILDNVSNHSLTDLRRVLTPTGTLIPNGGGFDNRWLASGGRIVRAAVLFQFGGQTLGNFLVSSNHADLVVLAEMIEAGKVTPVMDRTYPLSETARAIDHVGKGHARGKVVIAV